jgi:hypothetical protein
VVELMVAGVIIFVSLSVIAYVATIAFSGVAMARQRQSANGVANQAMEEVRALPFDSIKGGLDLIDLRESTDPNIVKNCNGVVDDFCFKNERIPRGDHAAARSTMCATTKTCLVPLVPHQFTATVGPTTYNVSVYLTYYNDVTTSSVYRATVIVSWANAEVKGVASQIQVQTTISSPAGCLSTQTHPFSAPCQPFFYISMLRDQGSVSVVPTNPAGVIVASVPGFDDATLWTPGHSADLQVEQISSVQGTSRTSGAGITLTGEDEQVIGKQAVSSVAGNDPSQGGQQDYQSVTTPAQNSQQLCDPTPCGTGNFIRVTSSAADTGTTRSTTSATTSPSHLCPTVSGVNQNDALPCGSTDSKQGGAMSTALSLQGSSLGTATLASVAAPSTKGVSFVNRDIPSSGDGLVHVDGTRYLGLIQLGGLPTGLASMPTGWATSPAGGYYVQLTGYNDSVSAESGASTSAPTVAATGTISYWNGGGYNTITVVPGASVSIPVAALTFTPAGTSVTVTLSGSLHTGGTATTVTPGCTSPCTRTSATASSASPVVGSFSYKVTNGATVVCDLTINVDFGGLSAKATYTASPVS